MTDRVVRILCVGHDSALLQTRCMILRHHGYHAEMAFLSKDGSRTPSFDAYDLLVLSKSLSAEERGGIRNEASEAVTILQLERLVGPDELLTTIKECALTGNPKALKER